MRHLVGIVVGLAATLLWGTGVYAAAGHAQPSHSVRLSTNTFSLTVAGTPDKGTTFWVSHGPLAGRFGATRLQTHGDHTYAVRLSLPVKGQTSFTYLAAQGVQIVHGTPQPGGAVTVIRSIDSVTASVAAQRTVRWSVPLG